VSPATWLILSLLSEAGLDLAAYRRRFGRDAAADFPELAELRARSLVEPAADAAALQLTDAGFARADAIGPWLSSPAVRRLMSEYELS